MFGLDSVPGAGEEFSVWASESAARDAAEMFLDKDRAKRLADMSSGGSMVTLSRWGSVGDVGGVCDIIDWLVEECKYVPLLILIEHPYCICSYLTAWRPWMMTRKPSSA